MTDARPRWFSKCRTYRYWLRREIDQGLAIIGEPKACVFVMLNPSTADEVKNDPTVERCERFAKRWGFDELIVVNLFALRSTDPKILKSGRLDPVGPGNNRAIRKAAQHADSCEGMIVCAWGVHGSVLRRNAEVLDLLSEHSFYALKVTKEGHPLYLRSDAEPRPFPT